MSGYMEAQLVILCLSTIYAYGIFIPAASGQLNLGAAGFITLGAYASAWFNSADGPGLPIAASIVLAMAFTGVVSFLISFPILRTKGVYMVLATFAFAEVVAGIIINIEFLGAAAGMPVDDHANLLVVAPIAVLVIVFSFYFMSTRFGLSLRSIHDDESVATLFGVKVRAARVIAFTVGAMIMSLGGSLYGFHFNYIEAQTFNVLLSIFILLYVLMGGTQTAWGPLIGAVFFVVVPELLRHVAELLGWHWLAEGRFLMFGVFIVLLMVVRPEGIMTRTLQERLSGSLSLRCQKASAADVESET
jgi:branched-chain amino acid transport system permease protein